MRVPVTDVPVPSQVVLSALLSVAQSYKLHNGIYTVSLKFLHQETDIGRSHVNIFVTTKNISIPVALNFSKFELQCPKLRNTILVADVCYCIRPTVVTWFLHIHNWMFPSA